MTPANNPAHRLHEVLEPIRQQWVSIPQARKNHFSAISSYHFLLYAINRGREIEGELVDDDLEEFFNPNGPGFPDAFRPSVKNVRAIVAFSELPRAAILQLDGIAATGMIDASYKKPIENLEQSILQWPLTKLPMLLNEIDSNSTNTLKVAGDLVRVHMYGFGALELDIVPSRESIERIVASLLATRQDAMDSSMPAEMISFIERTTEQIIDALSRYVETGNHDGVVATADAALQGLSDMQPDVSTLNSEERGTWGRFVDRLKDVVVLTTLVSQLVALPATTEGAGKAIDRLAGLTSSREIEAGSHELELPSGEDSGEGSDDDVDIAAR